ncbi:hypothetical protein SAMN05443428_107132 [Caloramator quimbayensis]|uniref:Uncharacterized protein n=1 Tax=Caloramator quimbayensis TaxID=1147123 RepID=A0A1T4XCP0_9CLOT|nr:hypothetical protein [Caloramator quimbayensis]SKA86741.1 hypothetical protein SAMN05443428_107132 [Caloramator quimbayensis]
MNYELKLNELKNKIEVYKNKKIKAETRLEQLQIQKDAIIKELNDLGVAPENLDNEIKKLDNEIKELIDKIESMMPSDI